MKEKITNFINKCPICQRAKYDRNPIKVPFQLTETPSRPFQILHLDTFQVEKSNYLTIIDAFTKLGQAFQILSKNAVEIAENLVLYMQYYYPPESFVTDNGPEFNSEVTKGILELHKIKIHFTTPHNPQSNGIVERFHLSILEHLRILRQNFPKDDINNLMQYAIIAYNSSIHSSTNYPPYKLTFGHINDMDIYNIDDQYKIVQNYVKNHKEKLAITYESVKNRLEHRKIQLHTKQPQFDQVIRENQEVYVQQDGIQRGQKTLPRYKGPLKVSKISDKNIISLKTKKAKKNIHTRKIKRPVIVTDPESCCSQQ